MNDRGTSATGADPLYQDAYSQFCYELPFMPGQTGYFDTPVIPVAAFARNTTILTAPIRTQLRRSARSMATALDPG